MQSRKSVSNYSPGQIKIKNFPCQSVSLSYRAPSLFLDVSHLPKWVPSSISFVPIQQGPKGKARVNVGRRKDCPKCGLEQEATNRETSSSTHQMVPFNVFFFHLIQLFGQEPFDYLWYHHIPEMFHYFFLTLLPSPPIGGMG